MEKVKKKLGFGCMRLPMQNGKVDTVEFSKMVDTFIENGFNYFDTAHGYVDSKSELYIKECLTSRYDRESYVLTDKLTNVYFNSNEEIRPFFENQLKSCGVSYFDFYLMHAQNKDIFEFFKKHRAYETALELKAEGKIRHFGISFHDKADVLDMILNEYPQIEVVQIQFNYVDYEDPAIESRKCYEVCRKHNKPVIIMEPVKGGNLVNIPDKAKEVFNALGDNSPASYAIRFAASFEGVMMVLSGMSNMEQMNDNISYMKDFKPLSDTEMDAVRRVQTIFKELKNIPCTACRYCIDGCPKHIRIPDLFSCLNKKIMYNNWNTDYYYNTVLTVDNNKASDCIKCGKCEKICPQHLEIRKLLESVANEFEK
ncbi:MAG: aldo/keto reductase [Clostridia bacterium]|nr:aldo/keto reductase [Clostridia bacterium]